jgi:hypothetical protein
MIPIAEIRLLIQYFKDRSSVPLSDALKAAAAIIAYGIDIVFTQPQLVSDSGPLSESEVLAYLESCQNVTVSPCPWCAIIRFLLGLIGNEVK